MSIEVKKLKEGEFIVTVAEGDSSTKHRVTLDNEYYNKLTKGNITREELIKKSFEFLLRHESKESILSSFDLRVISRYFPQYENEIKKEITA